MEKRGRPSFKPENLPILEYEQNFEDVDGTKYKWCWDKNINPNGPLSVTINDPRYNQSDKLIRELDIINKKYEIKSGQRKPRITKEDNLKILDLTQKIEDEHYRHFSDDLPQTKTRKNKKSKV